VTTPGHVCVAPANGALNRPCTNLGREDPAARAITSRVKYSRIDLDLTGGLGHPAAANFHAVTKVSATMRSGALLAS
jgi:hypothetical protein